MQALAGNARDGQCQRFTPGSMKQRFSGLAQNFRPPIIRNDQACLKGNDLGIKGLRNGKEKLVTEFAVLRPFLVNAKIFRLKI